MDTSQIVFFCDGSPCVVVAPSHWNIVHMPKINLGLGLHQTSIHIILNHWVLTMKGLPELTLECWK